MRIVFLALQYGFRFLLSPKHNQAVEFFGLFFPLSYPSQLGWGVIWVKMARILQGLESKVVIWRKMGEILQDLVIILENKVAISFKWGEALINLIGILHGVR